MKNICAILQAVSGGFSICQVVFGYIQPELFFDRIVGVVCAGCLDRTDRPSMKVGSRTEIGH